jgi:hypothetical protein
VCGRTATDKWITKQKNFLPPCQWQHVTFLNSPGIRNIFQLLEKQYDKYWRVHCAKHHKNSKKDIDYLDHRTKKNNMLQLEVFDFFDRFTQHIPERYFRMIRYFGFLSNRLRGRLLPIVNQIFNHNPKEDVKYPWQFLVKQKLGFNPLECILCRSQMRLRALSFGLSFRVSRETFTVF